MKTKTIQQTVRFKAAPQAVYELLMNSKKHTLLSGEKAVISTTCDQACAVNRVKRS
jgi:hypothetical protein